MTDRDDAPTTPVASDTPEHGPYVIEAPLARRGGNYNVIDLRRPIHPRDEGNGFEVVFTGTFAECDAWLEIVSSERARRVLLDVVAHLAAAISLLERSPRAGAASNKMFETMLNDYRDSLERGRAFLSNGPEAQGNTEPTSGLNQSILGEK